MSEAPTLDDVGVPPELSEVVSSSRAERLAACLDADPSRVARGALPPLWHWTCFVPTVPTAALGSDGHPRRRPEMAAFPQRMWVGGRVHVERALALDTEATRVSEVVRAERKQGGRAGDFWLVTVQHTVRQAGTVCVREEQQLAFRGAGALAAPGPDRADPPEARWIQERTADPVLLFRFSAVTNNAHRIHYDHPYAVGEEGYPDLVVHGPLTALLLAEFAQRCTGRGAHDVTFRAHAPHFANRRFWLTADELDDGRIRAVALRGDHEPAMTVELG